MANQHRNKVKRDDGRKPGWIGLRVTICGHPIHPEGTNTDFVCLLPPKHTPNNIHVTVATDDIGSVLTLVLNEEKGEIQWRE